MYVGMLTEGLKLVRELIAELRAHRQVMEKWTKSQSG